MYRNIKNTWLKTYIFKQLCFSLLITCKHDSKNKRKKNNKFCWMVCILYSKKEAFFVYNQ